MQSKLEQLNAEYELALGQGKLECAGELASEIMALEGGQPASSKITRAGLTKVEPQNGSRE